MSTRVLVFATVDNDQAKDFERAFAAVSRQVATTPGHISDQLLRNDRDGSYVLFSEWESREAFLAWEDAPMHRLITTPMRRFWTGRVERLIYDIAVRDGVRLDGDEYDN
ncbi:MAG: antibiotic biosynthesis monooxygenase [Propionibacteriales bacterium]|nr:antibiotic biosynthesis monooxygenase [Propionibacteriales bacterium]